MQNSYYTYLNSFYNNDIQTDYQGKSSSNKKNFQQSNQSS